MDRTALLISGTVGAGKTTVADALGDLLRADGVPGAVLDVDWLRRAWPAPPGDRFNHHLTLRNLRAVAANLSGRIVLAGVIESRADRDDYQAALDAPLTVGRLRVDLTTVRERLRRRHADDDEGLRWHLRRCGELDAILAAAAVEDFVIDGGGTIRQVANAMRTAAGW
ncbi:adenylyl-sulfate kinase [Actinoplanes sp. NPDC049265]|uniref:adenylyl-sulfate kinase n=1 Tax=Actinoplanes sp. NPDC049265 TaxID=3363902 RepID=UPI0037185A3A